MKAFSERGSQEFVNLITFRNFPAYGSPLYIPLLFLYIPTNWFEIYFMTPEAEKFNGWMAMIGFIAAFGAYATTGQIIPGIF